MKIAKQKSTLLILFILPLLMMSFSSFVDGPQAWPVDKSKTKEISVGFGKRIHPATHTEVFHQGLDFAIAEGEKVMTTAEGVVVTSEFHKDRGNFIVIKHGDRYTTSYSHLKLTVVKAGDHVALGDTIGFVGSTGSTTGPHLHYEVVKDGKNVDPAEYLPGTNK